MLHGSRHTEIPQSEMPEIINHDVLRLDVPVNDVQLFAGFQCAAHIQPQPEHFLFAKSMAVFISHQRRQKIHADEHIPADPVRMRHRLDITASDNIRVRAQPRHQLILPDHILHPRFVSFAEALPVIAVIGDILRDFILVLRNGDDLQSALFLHIHQLALNFINAPETPMSQPCGNLPLRPGKNNIIVHAHSLSLTSKETLTKPSFRYDSLRYFADCYGFIEKPKCQCSLRLAGSVSHFPII